MQNNYRAHNIFILALVCIATAIAYAQCAAQNTQVTQPALSPGSNTNLLAFDPVVAKGDGFEIRRSELDEAAIRHRAALARIGRSVAPDQSAVVDRQVLESLVQAKLLHARATDADRAKARALADKRFATERANAPSEEAFARRLKVAGLTADQFKARLFDDALSEVVLERELGVQVSDDAVKKYYDENPSKFEQPETVRIAHILFMTRDATGTELPDNQKLAKRKKAEEVLQLARKGEDFAKLAREYSDDEPTKPRGGELQPIARGTTLQWLPELEAAAFALPTNQVSEIIATRLGYHIIKVLEHTPPKIVELDKVADTIRQVLKARQFQKLAPDYFEKLKQDAKVEILDPVLKDITLPKPVTPGAED